MTKRRGDACHCVKSPKRVRHYIIIVYYLYIAIKILLFLYFIVRHRIPFPTHRSYIVIM